MLNEIFDSPHCKFLVSVSAREWELVDFDDDWPRQYASDFPRYLRSLTSSPSYTIESAPISPPVNKKFHLFHTLAVSYPVKPKSYKWKVNFLSYHSFKLKFKRMTIFNFNFQENWHKAYHTCLTHGMRLASISSKDENNLLVETIKEAGKS